MRSPTRTATSSLFSLLCVIAAGCGGAEVDGGGARADALRERFPSQAAHVLETPGAFLEEGNGFVSPSDLAGDPDALRLSLPRSKDAPIVVRTAEGFEVRVRESGLVGDAMAADSAVAYERSGGTSFWSVAPGGAEEWLDLEEGVAVDGAPVALWEVDGAASLRQHGNSVGLVDGAGVARIWVTAPVAFTAGGREVEPKLSVVEGKIAISVDAGGEAVLVDPSWSTRAPMAIARADHTATRMPNGQVLVYGGTTSQFNGDVPELFDPGTNTWTSLAATNNETTSHHAVPLHDGRVLFTCGGMCTFPDTKDLLIYNVTAQTYKLAALTERQWRPFAVLLDDGKVLVGGGFAPPAVIPGVWAPTTAVEVYNPATHSSVKVGSLAVAAEHRSAVKLADGRVLVAGGRLVGGDSLKRAEIYDPATQVWTNTAPMQTARHQHQLTLLADGRVLAAGGATAVCTTVNGSATCTATALASAEVYNPATNTWTAVGSMSTSRDKEFTATLLEDGNVFVFGREPNTFVKPELFNPSTGTWSATATQPATRRAHTATRLASGNVLVTGGYSSGFTVTNATMRYNP